MSVEKQLVQVIISMLERLSDYEVGNVLDAVKAEKEYRYYMSLCQCCELEEYINARNV